MRKQFIILTLLLAFAGWEGGFANPVQAHRVNVFAWVEGNTIYTTAKFSGGKVARESLVKVYDSREKIILEGKTDNQGTFSFPVPEIDNLKIVVEAGSGHRGEWEIKKSELDSVKKNEIKKSVTAAHKTESATPATAIANRPNSVSKADTSANTSSNLQITPEEIEKIVQKVVSKTLTEKLHPLTMILADIRNPDPGLKDILGGLGYILGLVGIIAYIKSRKQLTPGNHKQKS